MNFLKTTNGRVALYKQNGLLIRNIGSNDSNYATMRMDDYMILITAKDGSVKMYTETGNFVNVLKKEGATSATFIDNHILVFTMKAELNYGMMPEIL